MSRNRLAAVITSVSGIVFLISDYKADITFYYLIEKEILINIPSDFWSPIIFSIGILVIISQLGGITVLVGAGLFAANRVNLGKDLCRDWYRSGFFYHSITNYI